MSRHPVHRVWIIAALVSTCLWWTSGWATTPPKGGTNSATLIVATGLANARILLKGPGIRVLRRGAMVQKVRPGTYTATAWYPKSSKRKQLRRQRQVTIRANQTVALWMSAIPPRKLGSSQRGYKEAIGSHTACNVLHSRAKGRRKARLLALARLHCWAAAILYQDLLRITPRNPRSYDLTWYLGDTLYFSGQYKASIVHFRKVRDWSGQRKYHAEAAFFIIDALSKLVGRACKQGKIKRACEGPGVVPSHKASPPKKQKPVKPKPLPIPRLQQALIKARLFFVRSKMCQKTRYYAEQLFLLARVYQGYDHLVEARRWFWRFVKSFPRHRFARLAASGILASHYREKDLDAVVEAMGRLRKLDRDLVPCRHCGPYPPSVWAAVRKAEKAGQWAEAARAYVAIIDKNPKHKDAAPALWNAALLYGRAGRWHKSLGLYARIVRHYPTWKLADQALFRLADAAEMRFQLQKAIKFYMRLVDDRHFKTSRHRLDALYNTGLSWEALGQYQKAAAAFERYAQMVHDKMPLHAAKSLALAARLYVKAKQPKAAIKALQRLIRRHQATRVAARLVMQAHGEIMALYGKQARPFAFMKPLYKKVIAAFRRLRPKMSAADIAATRDYPGKARYLLAMDEYRSFLSLKLNSRSPRGQKQQVKRKLEAYDKVAVTLATIGEFQSAPWLLCALFRIAEGKMKIAEAIQKMPVPQVPGSSASGAASGSNTPFKDLIDKQFARPLENDALKKYRKVLFESRRLQIENDCTRGAQKALHRADPKSPMPRVTRPRLRFRTLSPMPLISALPSRKPKRQ